MKNHTPLTSKTLANSTKGSRVQISVSFDSCDHYLHFGTDLCTYITLIIFFQLRQHEQTHLSSNPLWPCDLCGKMFKNKGDMKKHQLIHSDTRPFTCDGCQKGWVQHLGLDITSKIWVSVRKTFFRIWISSIVSWFPVRKPKHNVVHQADNPWVSAWKICFKIWVSVTIFGCPWNLETQ